MEQLSFFGAGLVPATPDDIGVVMVAHGQGQLLFGNADTTRGRRQKPCPQSARISLVLAEEWQVEEFSALATEAGLAVEVVSRGESSLVRLTDPVLLPVVQGWTKGAVKTIPPQWELTPRALRVWAVVAGQWGDHSVQLRIDPHIAEQEALVQVIQEELARLGASTHFVGSRAGGPGVRVTGQRRLRNVMTLLGDPISDAPWYGTTSSEG